MDNIKTYADERRATPTPIWAREGNRTTALYDPYGWRAKLGLIIPSTNTVAENEWHKMVPSGVSVSTARILLTGSVDQASFDGMAHGAEEAARKLATAELDLVAYACTSGTFLCPREEITSSISEIAGCAATTSSEAVVAAMHALGAQRIALATPYVDFVNQGELRFLREEGFDVVRWYGLGLGETQEDRRSINRVPPEAIVRLARQVDHPDADCIFISCTAFAIHNVIDQIEQTIGKPVVASNQATLWYCLRQLNINEPIQGLGKLLAEH